MLRNLRSFGLSRHHARVWNNWRKKIKGAVINPVSPGERFAFSVLTWLGVRKSMQSVTRRPASADSCDTLLVMLLWDVASLWDVAADAGDSGDDVELTCHDGTVRDIVFMPDTSSRSSLMVSGGAGDCKVCVTDCGTGALLRAMPGHSGQTLCFLRQISFICCSPFAGQKDSVACFVNWWIQLFFFWTVLTIKDVDWIGFCFRFLLVNFIILFVVD